MSGPKFHLMPLVTDEPQEEDVDADRAAREEADDRRYDREYKE